MTKQEYMISLIKTKLEGTVADRGRKIHEFTVTDLGEGYKTKVLRFTVDAITGGNCFTKTRGQLFIGPKGGLKGRVSTFTGEAIIKGRREMYKVTMWV